MNILKMLRGASPAEKTRIIEVYLEENPEKKQIYARLYAHAHEALQQSTRVTDAMGELVRRGLLSPDMSQSEFATRYQMACIAAGEEIRTPVKDLPERRYGAVETSPKLPNNLRSTRQERGGIDFPRKSGPARNRHIPYY